MSLVGLMIGVTLSFVILAGGLSGYQSVKVQYLKNRERLFLSDLQRGLFQYLVKDLVKSGYLGPRTKDASFPIHFQFTNKIHHSATTKNRRSVMGFSVKENDCLMVLPESLCQRALEDREQAEVLVIYHIPKSTHTLESNMETPWDTLVTTDDNSINNHIKKNSLILIADRFQGDLFVANNVAKNLVYHRNSVDNNMSASLSKAYQKGTLLTESQTVAYYVGRSKEPGRWSLYRDDLFHAAEEILSGVSNIKFQYGIAKQNKNKNKNKSDDNEEIDENAENEKNAEIVVYKSAYQIEKWEEVKSVRIKVTAQNERTKEETPWEVEVALRNGNGFNFGSHFAHG